MLCTVVQVVQRKGIPKINFQIWQVVVKIPKLGLTVPQLRPSSPRARAYLPPAVRPSRPSARPRNCSSREACCTRCTQKAVSSCGCVCGGARFEVSPSAHSHWREDVVVASPSAKSRQESCVNHAAFPATDRLQHTDPVGLRRGGVGQRHGTWHLRRRRRPGRARSGLARAFALRPDEHVAPLSARLPSSQEATTPPTAGCGLTGVKGDVQACQAPPAPAEAPAHAPGCHRYLHPGSTSPPPPSL